VEYAQTFFSSSSSLIRPLDLQRNGLEQEGRNGGLVVLAAEPRNQLARGSTISSPIAAALGLAAIGRTLSS
jgi:hypothetical protein